MCPADLRIKSFCLESQVLSIKLQKEAKERQGIRIDIEAKLTHSQEFGRTREQVAEKVGVSNG